MAATHGCLEVTLQTVQTPEVTIASGMTPVHAVAAVHQGPGWGGRELLVLARPVVIDGTNLKIKTRGLRIGDCVCWTAYDA